MAIIFNDWELQYLQQTLNRWYDYKGSSTGGGSFGGEQHTLVASIKAKVQVASGISVSLTPEENNFLQSVLYVGRQDYGRGSGNSVFETGVRGQVQQRTVQITADILAKLRNALPPIINPGETEAMY